MAEKDLKLFGSRVSPYVHRVEWVLKMKGIEYEFVEENLMNKSPLLLKYNPVHKKIPVLVHGGKPIAESLVIIEYIDETWKENPILPEDPYERAIARFWARFIDEKLNDPLRNMSYYEGEEQEKEAKQAAEALDVIEGELKGKKFLGGNAIGFADITLGALTIASPVIDEIAGKKFVDPHKYPCMSKWVENFVEIPFVKENMPPKDKMVQGFIKFRSLMLGLAPKK